MQTGFFECIVILKLVDFWGENWCMGVRPRGSGDLVVFSLFLVAGGGGLAVLWVYQRVFRCL